jgi:broad specificity phosphatase PhoE
MIALALLRHGATAWNAERRIQGTTDLALSPAGRAAVARWRLPAGWPSRRWVTSPLARARETAAILAERHDGERAITVEPRLAEMSHGAWEGRRLADLRAELGAAMAANEARGLDYRAPGGESPRELQRRLRPWLLEIARGGEPVLAITHKGVIRALYAAATGWDMIAKPRDRLADAALHCFRLAGDGALAIDRLNLPLDGEATAA